MPLAISAATTGRNRRPLLYPLGISVAFILLMLDATGVSFFAATRALLVVGLATLLLTTLMTLILPDRHPAAVITMVLLLTAMVPQNPSMVALLLVADVLLVVATVLGRTRPMRVPWPTVSRGFTLCTLVILLAIGIRSVQDGRLLEVADDLVHEGPLRSHAATTLVDAAHPDIYLLMLDGYPRSDKLQAEFSIDNRPFLHALTNDGFTVSTQSRSNYVQTRYTLLSLFNGAHVDSLVSPFPTKAHLRVAISTGRALEPFTRAGYETVSISSGFEDVSLRQVDRFIDTGQLNEFERVLIQSTVLPALNMVAPSYFGDEHATRVRASFERALNLTTEPGPARLTFIHIASPHAPLILAADGSTTDVKNDSDPLDDRQQHSSMGLALFSQRLAGQIQYLDDQVLRLLDRIDRSGRPSIVVVFSDHGSGIRFSDQDPNSDYDLRTANLLAVRGIGLLDARSTLVNLLPRIASQVFGTPYTPQPEDIRIVSEDFSTFVLYQRPD